MDKKPATPTQKIPAENLQVGDIIVGDYNKLWDFQLEVTAIVQATNPNEIFIYSRRNPPTGRYLRDNRCELVYKRYWYTIRQRQPEISAPKLNS